MRIIKVILIVTFTTLCIVYNPISDRYVSLLKGETVQVNKHSNPLYEEIIKKSKLYEVAATDAKIDPIWKAIPGYNGRVVDIEGSYKKMKKQGEFSEDKLIFKQTKPKIHLQDLQAAPIYRGNQEKPMVAFIINVAWGNEYLPDMLATLKKHNVKTSFFLEGRWAKENPDLTKMIYEAGHEIGNHSYTHPDMKNLSAAEIKNQLQKTNDVIKATTGQVPKWFGPPSGSYRDDVVKIADVMGLGTIIWSVDTIDWQRPAPDVIIHRVESKVHPGALILMHPTAPTAKALDRLITVMEQKNLQIGTVSDTLSEDRIESN